MYLIAILDVNDEISAQQEESIMAVSETRALLENLKIKRMTLMLSST